MNDRPPSEDPLTSEKGTGDLGVHCIDEEVRVRLYHLLLDSGDITEFLDFLTRTAVDVLQCPDQSVHGGITLLRPRRAATVSSSDDVARTMDEAQYGLNDGPCLTSARKEREVYIDDIENLPATSPYRHAMKEFGMRSVLAVPIKLPGKSSSALNLYSSKPRAFGSHTQDLARRFADEASRPMQLAVRLANLAETGTNLRAAIEKRHVINTTVGIIMSQNHCSQEQAFAILRQASSARNIKLRTLAQHILDGIPDDHT